MRKRTILFLPFKKFKRKVNHSPRVTYPLEYRLQMRSNIVFKLARNSATDAVILK